MMNEKKVSIMIYLFIVVLYGIASLFFVINNGIFWDDYVWSGNNFKDYFMYSQMLYGFKFPGLFSAFIYMVPPFVVRIIVCVLHFLSGVFFLKLLQKERFSQNDSIAGFLLFLLFPLNISKYSLSIAAYFIYFFIFSVAGYLFTINIENISKLKYLPLRILILLLFSISFFFNSLLVFYAVPILYSFIILYRSENVTFNFKVLLRLVVRYIKKYPDFISLPFIFYAIRLLVQMTNEVYLHGVYHRIGYNTVKLKYLAASFFLVFDWFGRIFITIISRISLVLSDNSLSGLLIIASIVFFLFVKSKDAHSDESLSKPELLSVFGFLAIFLAAMPYIAIGYKFDAGIWNSRSLFLLPIGTVLFLIGFSKILDRKLPGNRMVFSWIRFITIALFLAVQIHIGNTFFYDDLKQKSMIANFKMNNDIRTHNVFLIEDKAASINPFRSYFTYYEYSGMFNKAFNTVDRIGVDLSKANEVTEVFNGRYDLPYKSEDCPHSNPEILIRIYNNGSDTSYITTAKILLSKAFNKSKYNEYVEQFISVKTFPISD